MASRKERERAARKYYSLYLDEIGRITALNSHLLDYVKKSADVSPAVFDALMPGWFDLMKERLATDARSIVNLSEMLRNVEELRPWARPNELVDAIANHIAILRISRALTRDQFLRMAGASLQSPKRTPTEEAASAAAYYVDRALESVDDILKETVARMDEELPRLTEIVDRVLHPQAEGERRR